jgi:hypothetical protein
MIFTRRRRLPTPVRSPIASSAIPARSDTSSPRMQHRSSETRRSVSLVPIMDYPCTWLRLSRRREAFACGNARNSGVRQVSRMRQVCWRCNVITLRWVNGPGVHGKRTIQGRNFERRLQPGFCPRALARGSFPPGFCPRAALRVEGPPHSSAGLNNSSPTARALLGKR